MSEYWLWLSRLWACPHPSSPAHRGAWRKAGTRFAVFLISPLLNAEVTGMTGDSLLLTAQQFAGGYNVMNIGGGGVDAVDHSQSVTIEAEDFMSLFFLMCSERSGSNFITKLVNGHTNICGPSTKHVVNPVARNVFRYGDLKDPENWESLLADIYNLISVEFSFWRVSFSIDGLRELAPKGDIKSLIQNIFLEEARANNKQHVFIKENHVYEFMSFLLTNFPESKFVYMVRDPRDMALSWKKNADHPGGVVKAARQWKQDQQQSMKNHFLLAAQARSHFLTYEDLTKDSQNEVEKLFEFLGVPHEHVVFDFHKDEITQKNARAQKAWLNLDKGVMKDNSGKYVDELSRDEIKAIEKICFYEMKQLAYEPCFSESELMGISDSWLDELNEKEFANVELRRSLGVRENMKAKAKFYRRWVGMGTLKNGE
ncbi:MAG: sulfotransferase [Pseudomonadota bacterium]